MPVFAIPVGSHDPEILSETKSVLERMAEVVPQLLQSRRQRKFDAIVEALTADVNISSTRLIEAEMKASAMTKVLQNGDLVPAAEVARLAGYSGSNPSSQPNRWKKAGQIFAVQHKGLDYYPLYALDPRNGYKPYPVVAKVLEILKDRDAWGGAFWFASLNGYLGGKRPQDLLATHPDKVIAAAEDEALGLQDG